MKSVFSAVLSLLLFFSVKAQDTHPVNGAPDKRLYRYAFTNATLVLDAQKSIKGGTMLVNGDVIEAIGEEIEIPQGYIVVDLKGKYVYPSFIDAFSNYGMPPFTKATDADKFLSTKRGPYAWNEAVRPEVYSNQYFNTEVKRAAELRKLGFGMVNAVPRDGIVRGASSIVLLADSREHNLFVSERATSNYSFDKGSSKTEYPTSLMGAIALLRQTYFDGRWYAKQSKEYNISLEEFNKQQSLPQIFEANNYLDVLRADKVGDEFGKQYIFKTSGDEFKRISSIKATKGTFIIPLNFPKPFNVASASLAKSISYAQMKAWELAPSNPAALEAAAIPFAFTTSDLENVNDFYTNLRKAIDYGLTHEEALKALTETPAKLLGIYGKVGSLTKGKLANFVITSKEIFSQENVIYENWIKGIKYTINNLDEDVDFRGNYILRIIGRDTLNKALNVGGKTPLLLSVDTVDVSMKIGGTSARYEVKIERIAEDEDTTIVNAAITRDGDWFDLSYDLGKAPKGLIRLSGYVASSNPLFLRGTVVYPDGSAGKFEGYIETKFKDLAAKKSEIKAAPVFGTVVYPFSAFGYTEEEAPKAERFLIRDATIWTCEKEGKLYNADLLIENGKIKAIGKDLYVKEEVVEIDAKGKHITPGIIDEHSHIAIAGGVNESAQAVTSEVSVNTVIDPEDINIYRQLAGGVTAAHLLHGSANPIGGQSALIKLRWGQTAEGLLFGGNQGFIKFALGENVKQSNWGDKYTSRFPQTRMGVEQVYYDAFSRAREYKQNWEEFKNGKRKGEEPRKDLALEALVEVLDNKRNITCHSYVQSEINMLMNLSDSLGFKVNTFTHILEGYKLAAKLRAKGIAASTFSDWWAYKMEAVDAIPYNASLMVRMGVLTAINSDDPEMGRRLNQEAAKAMKYGGLTDVDALKMITIYPARMLRIEDRVGSLKVGKDADFVIWNGSPMSIYSRVEKTFIEGIPYYDADQDLKTRRVLESERAKIIQRMIEAKNNGSTTQEPSAKAGLYETGQSRNEGSK